jgi:ATP-binding protein involved in chromosome partitioning
VSSFGAVVAVGSGKGGVGKSTVSPNVALALVESGARVGLLDADFYGPDIPLMVNVKQTRELKRWDFWRGGNVALEPVERYGLKIMSVGFVLAEHQALAWPGMMVQFVGRQLVHDVRWGELDYLIVDLPPGTADVQQQLVSLLLLAGAVVVVTPQDVAHLDAKRVVEMFQDARIKVLGGVENMAGLACPHCGEHVDLFPTVPDDRSLWTFGVERLGSIPFDPSIAVGGDAGAPVIVAHPESAQAEAFRTVATRVTAAL